MTEISLSSSSPAKTKADAVVIGVVRQDGGIAVAEGGQAVEAAMGRSFLATLSAVGVDGAKGTVAKLPTAGAIKAPVLVVVGLGDEATAGDHEVLRRAAGTAARSLEGAGRAAFALPAVDAVQAGAVAEGALLGAYAFATYKTSGSKAPLASVTLLSTAARDKTVAAAVRRAGHVAAAVNVTRDWINTPPNDMTPAAFADAARTVAKEAGLSVEVLDEKALAKGGYGGILAVGQGSANPPRLVRIAYSPRKPVAKVAFVGKGITFDSGGLSIKPHEGMGEMKSDMSGAAAVVNAVAAIARLGLPVEVVCYAALAENMPSGSATRPSDVYRAYGGKTVEVLNTDAEGRLVLADAIVRAGEDHPDAIIDVATLTGHMVIALGHRVSGIIGNDDALRSLVHESSRTAGEQMWPMPLPESEKEKLDSPVADLQNIGDRPGGALQAGWFLAAFVPDGVPWAHLDIAGPSFHTTAPYGYTHKGGTGEGVRTLVVLAEQVAAGRLR